MPQAIHTTYIIACHKPIIPCTSKSKGYTKKRRKTKHKRRNRSSCCLRRRRWRRCRHVLHFKVCELWGRQRWQCAACCTARWVDKMAEKHWATRICTRYAAALPTAAPVAMGQKQWGNKKRRRLQQLTCKPHASQSIPIKVYYLRPLSFATPQPFLQFQTMPISRKFGMHLPSLQQLQIIHLKSDSHSWCLIIKLFEGGQTWLVFNCVRRVGGGEEWRRGRQSQHTWLHADFLTLHLLGN